MEVKVGRGDPTQATVQSGIQGEGVESRVVLHKDWCLERVSPRGPTAHEDDKLCHTFRYASYRFSLPISDKTAPSATRDGRSLIAIGCVEGLWIGDSLGPQCKYPPHAAAGWEFDAISYSLPPYTPSSDDTTMHRTRRVRDYPNTRPQCLSLPLYPAFLSQRDPLCRTYVLMT